MVIIFELERENKENYFCFHTIIAEPSYQPQGTNAKTSSFLSERELKLLVLEVGW